MPNRYHAALSLLCCLFAPACDAVSEPEDSELRASCFPGGGAGLIGLDAVSMGGTPVVGGAAGVFSNELVELWGTADLESDAMSGGKVVVGANATVGGAVVEDAGGISVPDPSEDVAAAATTNDNAKIPCLAQGNQCTSPVANGVLTLNVRSELVLPAGTYYFKGIAINGRASLGTAGDVTIYLDGPATFNGGSSTDGDDDTLKIVSSSSDAIKINGGAEATMHIFAPFADVTFSGTTGFHGTALGKTITTVGTADITLSGSVDDLWAIDCNTSPADIPEDRPD